MTSFLIKHRSSTLDIFQTTCKFSIYPILGTDVRKANSIGVVKSNDHKRKINHTQTKKIGQQINATINGRESANTHFITILFVFSMILDVPLWIQSSDFHRGDFWTLTIYLTRLFFPFLLTLILRFKTHFRINMGSETNISR